MNERFDWESRQSFIMDIYWSKRRNSKVSCLAQLFSQNSLTRFSLKFSWNNIKSSSSRDEKQFFIGISMASSIRIDRASWYGWLRRWSDAIKIKLSERLTMHVCAARYCCDALIGWLTIYFLPWISSRRFHASPRLMTLSQWISLKQCQHFWPI